MYETLALLGAFAFAYSVIGSRLERTPFGGPVFFLAFGFLAGPIGIGLLDLDLEAEGMKTVAELTLALVLFTDAANSNLSVLGRSIRLPERLLLIGLPLTILLDPDQSQLVSHLLVYLVDAQVGALDHQ